MQIYTINPGENAVNIPIPYGERCELCVEGVLATNEFGSIYTDKRRCVSVSCNKGEYRSTNFVDDSELNDDVRIFPNPTNNEINIQLSGVETELVKYIEFIDMSGKKIKTLTTNSNSVKIDISSHPQGLYFIQCRFGDRVIHKKILKS